MGERERRRGKGGGQYLPVLLFHFQTKHTHTHTDTQVWQRLNCSQVRPSLICQHKSREWWITSGICCCVLAECYLRSQNMMLILHNSTQGRLLNTVWLPSDYPVHNALQDPQRWSAPLILLLYCVATISTLHLLIHSDWYDAGKIMRLLL